MAFSCELLSLPDEALSPIFLAVGSGTVYDRAPCSEDDLETLRARLSLAACCKRLNSIYRSTVRILILEKDYDESTCARLWKLFPLVTDLRLTTWQSGMPTFRFWMDMVRNGIKSVVLERVSWHVLDLQALLESFTGLETLELRLFDVHLDPESADYSDEQCSFSLERHAPTLRKLTIFRSYICVDPPDDDYHSWDPAVDFRWLKLSNLSVLSHLELSNLKPSEGTFFLLATLFQLHSLALLSVEIEDEHLTAILPSLSQLRTVKLRFCEQLTYRVLQFLPLDLDCLDVFGSGIVGFEEVWDRPRGPPECIEGVECAQLLPRVRKRTGSVKLLYTSTMADRNCMLFLRMYAGKGIMALAFTTTDGSYLDLVYLLSRTPNLVRLRISVGKQVDEDFDRPFTMCIDVYSALSQLSRLRYLSLRDIGLSPSAEELAVLANGPCRHSLLGIHLSGRHMTEATDLTNFCRLVSQRYDRCLLDVSD